MGRGQAEDQWVSMRFLCARRSAGASCGPKESDPTEYRVNTKLGGGGPTLKKRKRISNLRDGFVFFVFFRFLFLSLNITKPPNKMGLWIVTYKSTLLYIVGCCF